MNSALRFVIRALVLCTSIHMCLPRNSFRLDSCRTTRRTSLAAMYGVDAHGTTVVGGANANGQDYGFIWRSGEGMQSLDVVDHVTAASRISDNGTVVVGHTGTSSSISSQPFILRNGNDFRTTNFGSAISGTTDVSADGSVAVGWSNSGFQSQAFRWTEQSGFEMLGPTSSLVAARGVSPDGKVIVGQVNNQAVRWDSANNMTGIGFLPNGNNSDAYGVSENGNVIVGDGVSILSDRPRGQVVRGRLAGSRFRLRTRRR